MKIKKKALEKLNDNGGIRTHALSDRGLNTAP